MSPPSWYLRVYVICWDAQGEIDEPLPGESWGRVMLLPGLELHVLASAGEVVRRLAREILARYGAGPVGNAKGGIITQGCNERSRL